MSRVQEALLQQMAEEDQRRAALEEAALREREARVQRERSQVVTMAGAQPATGGSLLPPGADSNVNALAAQNAERRKELERRRSALIEEEQVVEAMKRSAEDERLRREAIRKKQEAEAEALRHEQQELQRKEREIIDKKRQAEEAKKKLDAVVQDATTAEAKLLEAQRLREQQQKDLERQQAEEEARKREQAELQQSFYSSLVNASKLVAQNSNRLFALLDQQFAEITQPNSPTASFFGDVKRLLDRTTQRLVSLLEDNVLNLDNDLYSSIANATRDVRTSAQTMLTSAEKFTGKGPEASVPAEERTQQLRHQNVALNFSIKTLLEELEALKVAESTSMESVGVLQAQSVHEAAVLVDRQLEVQSARRDSVAMNSPAAVHKKESNTRFRPTKAVSMSPQQLASYDRPAVRKLQKKIRAFVVRSKLRGLAATLRTHPETQTVRHRTKLLREVVESEATYLSACAAALQHFLPAMQAATNQNPPPLHLKDVQAIFGSLDLIYALNSEILVKMQNRLKEWPKSQKFGDILSEAAPRLQIYTDYVNNFDVASEVYKRLYANKAFQDLMKTCMEKAKSRLDLPSLLIQPVQRLPRYQLLLKELIKLSDETHVDRKNLQEAVQKITAVNVEINKRKKEMDNAARINSIKREISGLDADLQVPNRLFIRSGAVGFSSSRVKGTSHAQVYLFNDVVIVAKMLKKDSPPPFELQEKIQMPKIEVQDVDKSTPEHACPSSSPLTAILGCFRIDKTLRWFKREGQNRMGV